MDYSSNRHSALLKVVYAQSDEELKAAHASASNELFDKNIWMVLTPAQTFLSRNWPEPPNVAIVSFPDRATAIRVCKELGLHLGPGEFEIGVISYKQAIEVANQNSALLVMVAYDGDTPHYVPISHLKTNL